jgi:inositol-1,3,4-trisphosphate 5/6-kinase/inositol-tetrakisphosphate 1-kinase
MDMLQNRVRMVEAIEVVLEELQLVTVKVPQWSVDFTDFTNCKLVLGKPMDACGSPSSHIMSLISSHAPDHNNSSHHHQSTPKLYQRFIDHHCTLYKLYVIGGFVDVVVRASVSADIFRDMNVFEYGVTVGKACLQDPSDAMSRISPHLADITRFIGEFRARFGLTLFGVDVIIGEHDNLPYIIDVNYFPGFDGVPDLAGKLNKALLH